MSASASASPANGVRVRWLAILKGSPNFHPDHRQILIDLMLLAERVERLSEFDPRMRQMAITKLDEAGFNLATASAMALAMAERPAVASASTVAEIEAAARAMDVGLEVAAEDIARAAAITVARAEADAKAWAEAWAEADTAATRAEFKKFKKANEASKMAEAYR